jgi:HSP20 family protein
MVKKSTGKKIDKGNGVPDNPMEMKQSITSFQRAMNQLIDDFFTNFDLLPLSVFEEKPRFIPKIDIKEDETRFVITAELPGMEEGDIEITLSKDTLSIKGEKKKKANNKTYASHYTERSFGSFLRTIPVPSHIDFDKAEASFRNGVLKIFLPKISHDLLSRRRIPIKSK